MGIVAGAFFTPVRPPQSATREHEMSGGTTTSFFVSGLGSGAYSAKLFTGTRQRFSGFSQPRQCGDDVLRMLVTGGPPVRGGGGMPHRIMLNSRPVSYPFNLLNICLVTDPGGAVVLTRADRAKDCAKPAVYVRGFGEATEHVMVTQMDSLSVSAATRLAPGWSIRWEVLPSTISAPASRTSRQCMPFMAPAVPTGMNAGVRTTPCGVVSFPVRASPSCPSSSK